MKSEVKYVYVAGPYTQGNIEDNVQKAIDAGEKIALLGAIPCIPHLDHWWHLRYQHDYEFWLRQGMYWLQMCDALFCLPGESEGAEGEVQYAVEYLEIPVFYNMEDLKQWVEKSPE